MANVSGADVIALRKVPIQAADYAWSEYGVSQEDVEDYEEKAIAEHHRLKKAGKLEYLTTEDLRKKREKTSGR